VNRVGIMAVLSIAIGLLACGCLWGIVTDADTGDPKPFVEVRWKDSHDRWGETTTGNGGLYVFDVREGDDIPVPGPVTFYVGQPFGNCAAPVQERLVEYDDRPASTPPADPWEIQNFAVQCASFSRPTIVVPPATPSATKTPAPSPTPTPTLAPLPRLLPTATPNPLPR